MTRQNLDLGMEKCEINYLKSEKSKYSFQQVVGLLLSLSYCILREVGSPTPYFLMTRRNLDVAVGM